MANIDEVYDLLCEMDLKIDALDDAVAAQADLITDISSRLFELEMPTGGGFELES